MHVCAVIALLLFGAAAILAGIEKAYPLALIAAGLAVYVAPAAFQLSS